MLQKENPWKGKTRLKNTNLNAKPKKNFSDNQGKGTDLKTHPERAGTRSQTWGWLVWWAGWGPRFPLLAMVEVGAVLWPSLSSAEHLPPKAPCPTTFISFQLCSIVFPTKFKCQREHPQALSMASARSHFPPNNSFPCPVPASPSPRSYGLEGGGEALRDPILGFTGCEVSPSDLCGDTSDQTRSG